MDFYFNSAQITNPIEGSVTAGVFTPADTTTHPGVLIDEDLRLSTNFAGTTVKGIRFTAETFVPIYFHEITASFDEIGDIITDIGTAGTGRCDYLIVYREDTSNNPNMEVWVSDNSITGYTKIFDDTIESGNKFSINSLTSSSGKYFVVQFKGTYNIDVAEILLAEGVQGLFRQSGIQKQSIPAILTRSGALGNETSNKTANLKYRILLNWELLEQTYANKIASLRDGVFNKAQPFLLVDGANRTWNRLIDKPVMTERGYQHYSTSLNMMRFL